MAHLTIFVCCHQLVDLLIGPGSQDLNETLLIGADALREEKGRVSQARAGIEATGHRLESWNGQNYEAPSIWGAPTALINTDWECCPENQKTWVLVPPLPIDCFVASHEETVSFWVSVFSPVKWRCH